MFWLPTPEDVIVIHTVVIKETGGSDGLRDPGALAVSVARSSTSFGGREVYADVFTKAAATLESIARNHPFFDGNKRTSFMAALAIIERNAHTTSFDNKDIEETVVRIVVEKISLEEIATWLRNNSTPIDRD